MATLDQNQEYHRIVSELRRMAEYDQQSRAIFRKSGDGPWERVTA